MNLWERIENYAITFPKRPPPAIGQDGRLFGMWFVGVRKKRKHGYYGEYPQDYLPRVMALFPDKKEREVFHLFSGAIERGKYIRVDINPKLNPDIIGDAENLSEFCPDGISLIIADPPYSKEDAEHYGTSLVSRNKVVKECAKVLPDGGFLVWLDQAIPVYKVTGFNLIGLIGVILSPNHRIRMAFIFQKSGK